MDDADKPQQLRSSAANGSGDGRVPSPPSSPGGISGKNIHPQKHCCPLSRVQSFAYHKVTTSMSLTPQNVTLTTQHSPLSSSSTTSRTNHFLTKLWVFSPPPHHAQLMRLSLAKILAGSLTSCSSQWKSHSQQSQNLETLIGDFM